MTTTMWWTCCLVVQVVKYTRRGQREKVSKEMLEIAKFIDVWIPSDISFHWVSRQQMASPQLCLPSCCCFCRRISRFRQISSATTEYVLRAMHLDVLGHFAVCLTAEACIAWVL